MKKLLAKLTIAGATVNSFIASAFAENPMSDDPIGIGVGNNVDALVKNDFKTSVVNGINYFLTFLGLLVVVMIIYAGVLFVTAQGDEKQIEKAKKMILWSAVGMIIVMFSFAIVRVVAGVGVAAG